MFHPVKFIQSTIKIKSTKVCIKLKSYIVSAQSHNSIFDQVFTVPPNLTWKFRCFQIFHLSYLNKLPFYLL